ncbi:MAG: glycosyltransferase family 2 protein [Anaerolineaceae bacterium]|nr:glycosyltransferase family 2 protein [Anaerolineaceae bacterium]MCB9101167.1 glycosyltransferase family 2 protein [Anaerolineales bacterium]
MMIDAWPIVTVIMPVLNEAAFIRRSLGAVLAQDYPQDRLEILVVDGGSNDGTGQIVQELLKAWPRSRLLDNPRRIQSAALNIGIQAAAGEIIIRVDGHALIEPDYVKTCVRLLANGEFENVGGLMRPVGNGYVGQGIALATTSFFGIAGSKFHYSNREQVVDTVYMGAFRRTIFDRIGLFDEQLKINEDYEFNYRLRQAGGKILLSPALKSTYVPRHSLGALWRQYFQYGRWKVRMLQKHPTSLRWRQAVSPVFVGAIAGSSLMGLFWQPARWLLAGLTGSYLLASWVASTIAARRGGWRYLPILPIIFATIHWAWGLGFWYSLLLTITPQGGKLKR